MQKTNANPEADPNGPLDVWLKFSQISEHEDDHIEEDTGASCPRCGEAEAEANTYLTDTGYQIRWYLNSTGLVQRVDFDTLADAYDWYEDNGFTDYTVNE